MGHDWPRLQRNTRDDTRLPYSNLQNDTSRANGIPDNEQHTHHVMREHVHRKRRDITRMPCNMYVSDNGELLPQAPFPGPLAKRTTATRLHGSLRNHRCVSGDLRLSHTEPLLHYLVGQAIGRQLEARLNV